MEKKLKRPNIFLVCLLIALLIVSGNSFAAVPQKILNQFVALDDIQQTGLQFFINENDLTHDIEAGDVSLKMFLDGRSLLKEKTYPQNIKVEIYTVIDGKKSLHTILNKTIKNKKSAQRVLLLTTLPRVEESEQIYFDVYDTHNILHSTFIETIHITSAVSTPASSNLSSVPDFSCADGDGECLIEYLLRHVTFSANYDRNLKTVVYKNDKGRYYVNIPIKKGRTLNSKVKKYNVNGGGNNNSGGNSSNTALGSYPFFEDEAQTGRLFWDSINQAIKFNFDGAADTFSFKKDGSFELGSKMTFAQGELMSTPVPGSLEYDGTDLYFTNNSSRVRLGAVGPPGPPGPPGPSGPAGSGGSGSGVDLSNGGFLNGTVNFIAGGQMQDAIFNGSFQYKTGAANGLVLTSDANGNAHWDNINIIINSTILSTGPIGAVQFSGTSNGFDNDANNFFWDDTNNRLGIGTNSPTQALEVRGFITGGSQSAQISNGYLTTLDLSSSTINRDAATFNFPNSDSTFTLQVADVIGTNDLFFQGVADDLVTDNGYFILESWASAGLVLSTGGFAGTGEDKPIIFSPNRDEGMRLTSNGELGIGTASPQARLSINGDIAIRDGTQATGFVLTSDANGLASWQAAPSGVGVNGTASGTAGAIQFSDGTNGFNSNATTLSWNNPLSRLNVDGDIRLPNGGSISSANNSNLTFTTVNNIGRVILDSQQGVAINLRSNSTGNFSVQNANGELFSVDSNSQEIRIGRSTLAKDTYILKAANSPSGAHQGNDLKIQAGNSGTGATSGGDLYLFGGSSRGSGANGNLILAHNGTSAIGNIGIGFINPSAKLDINGSIAIRDGSQTDGFVLTSDANGLASWQAASSGAGVNGTASGIAGAIQFSDGTNGFDSDASNLFWDGSNGRLGIGTTTPAETLEIEAGNLLLDDPASTVYFNDTNSYLRVVGGNMQWRSNGNAEIRPGGNNSLQITPSLFDYNYGGSPSFDARFQTDNSPNMPFIDAGADTVLFGTTIDMTSLVGFQNINQTDIVTITKGANGQTANLSEWQDFNGTTLVSISPRGQLTIADGTQANSFVLTSDINGNASWQAAPGAGLDTNGSATYWNIDTNVVSNTGSSASTANDDFVFGSPDLNYDSNLNHANRFFFDKGTAAFRAGRDIANNWDNTNLGNYSFATGNGTIANGDGSFAGGYRDGGSEISSRGAGSLAFGASSINSDIKSEGGGTIAMGSTLNNGSISSSGIGSIAMGVSGFNAPLRVSGIGSFAGGVAISTSPISVEGNAVFAYGSKINIDSDYSSALGTNLDVKGDYNHVSGASIISNGNYNHISGRNITLDGQQSHLAGYSLNVEGDYNYSIGRYNEVNGDQTFTLGKYLYANGDSVFLLGAGNVSWDQLSSNISNSLSVGFNSNTATLFVGPSNGGSTTGDIGIATTNPQAKLDIIGDIAIRDGTQADGFVLTSDANGLASWQAAPIGVGVNGTASGAAGAIQFSDGASGFDSNDADFYWDNVNGRALIGDRSNFNTSIGANAGNRVNNTYNVSIGESAGANSTGDFNVYLGANSGSFNTGNGGVFMGLISGNGNRGNYPTFIGFQSGQTNTGDHATGIGFLAGRQNSGNGLMAFGTWSGWLNSGTNVLALGPNSATANRGDNLIALGYQSGSGNQGNGVLAIGQLSAYTNTGNGAIAIGQRAIYQGNGDENIAIGQRTLYNNNGDFNIAIGYNAGDNAIDADRDILIGYNANPVSTNQNGQLNIGNTIYGDLINGEIALGKVTANPAATLEVNGSFMYTDGNEATGFVLTSDANGLASWQAAPIGVGVNGTASGAAGAIQFSDGAGGFSSNGANFYWDNVNGRALIGDSSNFNTTIGKNAGTRLNNQYNISIGENAGANTTGDYSLSVGINAGFFNTGNGNTMIGPLAGMMNTGEYNSFSGMYSGWQNRGDAVVASGVMTGRQNVGNGLIALGQYAGWLNQSDDVIAIGNNASVFNFGRNIISLGQYSAYSNQGDEVIALGQYSAGANYGNGAIAIGQRAVYAGNGDENIAIGQRTLFDNNGDFNIAIGYNAGDNAIDADRDILIGYNANPVSTNQNGQLNIGNTIYGDLINGEIALGKVTANPAATLEVNGSFMYTDGNEATGFVLTSDANGLASWQAAGGGSSSGIAGAIQFSDGAGGFNSNVNLNWNNTNGELSIGHSGTPAETLDVSGNMIIGRGSTSGTIYATGQDVSTLRLRAGINSARAAALDLYQNVTSNHGRFNLQAADMWQDVQAPDSTITAGSAWTSAVTNLNGGNLVFQAGAPNGAGDFGSIVLQSTGGNVGIGTSLPTAKLEVNGSTIIDGVISSKLSFDNTSGAAVTVDWNESNRQEITLGHNATFTFTDPTGIANLTLFIYQDATGSRIPIWPANVRWSGGGAPTLTTTANQMDIISCVFKSGVYYCQAALDFTP